MPRIPEQELERIKRDTDLLALVRESGVELARHGKDWLGLCVHHRDTSPSLVVSPEKGLWQCLGACHTGGSAIDWVMKSRGVGFREAAELLQRRLGTAPLAAPSSVAAPASPISEGERAQLLGEVLQHYQRALARSAEPKQYAAARLITPAAIERFRLGYADRTLGLALQKLGAAGRDKREMLKAIGVLRESGHGQLNGCLVIPVLSPSGSVLNLYGRRLNDYPGTPKHWYLSGPRRGVWNPEGLQDTKELILCESLIDALTFWCAGFEHVTTSWGVNGFTTDHLAAIEAAGIERLLIAYDNDKAGNDAAHELAQRLGEKGIDRYRVGFPRGLDANEYARKVTPARESLALVLRSAEWMAGPREAPAPAAVAHASASHPAERRDSAPQALISEPPRATEASPPPATSPERAAAKEEAFDPKQPLDVAMGDRRWRVRGLDRQLSYEKLQVLLRVGNIAAFFVDTVDMAQAKQRGAFVRAAATELGTEEEVIKKDLLKLHVKLEELQDRLIREQLAPQAATPPTMAPAAEAAALDYLRQPNLLDRILADFDRCGVVGERVNKLLGYLAATSRKLEQPLAVIIQSSSAAGKSSLMEAILAFMPEEERVQYSAMTGQSLFYMGESDLAHKILAIVEEEGAERASYALKLLQSEGELTIASTGKDPETGRLVTHEYRVQGPVAIFLTTTAIDVDEELLNRCLVLSVDESREQTRAIHELQRQRRTLEGLLARRERPALVELHRNVQRLLQPLPVVNPHARRLTFLDTQTRTRRDHEKYLNLIEAIALLHQHQRPRQRASGGNGGGGVEPVDYIEATLEDVELANRLAGEVLGRSLDELPPQTRRFLTDLDAMVATDCDRLAMNRCDYRFYRRQVAEQTGWSYDQVRRHVDRLVELEYVLVHRGSRGQSMVYELLYDGEGAAGRRFLPGLIDASSLATTSASLAAQEGSLATSMPGFGTPLAAHWGPIGPPLAPAAKPHNLNGRNGQPAAEGDGQDADASAARRPRQTYVMSARRRDG
jgi:DNA primase catalytic core